MKKHQKHLCKNKLKNKRRILKVLKAIFQMEQHTAFIASVMHPFLVAVGQAAGVQGLLPQARPASNKKKMDEFRENWLDKQEVIRLMPVSERSLYALRKEGKLPSYTFKGKIYFKLKDVESLMHSKETRPALAS